MSKLVLKPMPTLGDLQAYVAEMVVERGWENDDDIALKFMMLIEEVGEFAKAARKSVGLHYAEDSAQMNAAHEAADIFMMLLNLCNLMGIDLERAFRDKEEINKQRKWR